MNTYNRNVILLGNFGTPSVFDPDKDFVGLNFNSNQLSVQTIQINENFNRNGYVVHDTQNTGFETITYFGSVTEEVFNSAYYKATVTLADGSVKTGVNVGIFYTDTGTAFLNEFNEQGQLDGLQISSIKIDSIVDMDFDRAYVDSSLVGTSIAPSTDPVDPDPVNSAPVLTNAEPGEFITIPENQKEVRNIDAVDANGDALTYSIVGGADAARFTIDPNTGQLDFITAPDFEGENSAIGNDDIYDVTVRVEDGKGGSDEANLFINVTDVDEGPANSAPVLTNAEPGETINIPENQKEVRNIDALDVDGDNLTFSIVGGADADRFVIDPATGQLDFKTAPDFEGENSAVGNDDIYDVTVRVEDGKGGSDEANLFVNVTDVDEIVPELSIEPAPGAAVDGNGNPIVDEGGEPLDAIEITRSGPTDQPLTVTLASDDETEATVPATVTIPAGQSSVTVPVTPQDDDIVDGTQFPTITASAPGFDPVTETIAVNDDDVANSAPVANDDPGNTTDSVTPIELDVLGNDTDADGDALTASNPVLNDPALGTVEVVNNKVVYTPSQAAVGITAEISYTATDPDGASDTATAFVYVSQGAELSIEPAPGAAVDSNGNDDDC